MHCHKWPFALATLLVAGVLAACGGGDDSSDAGAGGVSAGETSSPEDVYQACLDVANEIGETLCVQVRDGFQECIDQSSDSPAAAQACEEAAHRATEALESSP